MSETLAAVGSPAPEFQLPCTAGDPDSPDATSEVCSRDFLGQWLILVFYPRDFSLVCPTELTALSERLEEFRGLNSALLAISVDSVESHRRWMAAAPTEGGLGSLGYPLASDENGATARAYGVYLEEEQVCQRGLFVVDPEGRLQYQVVHNHNVGRGTEEVLRVLTALQTGGLCSADWHKQQAPLDVMTQLQPGRVVSHYRIVGPLGTGTFGAVFEAEDMMLKRPVALKILKPGGSKAPNAILAEARSAAALNHPNVCTVYAVDDSVGLPVIAMEHISGRPLSRVLEDGPMDRELTIKLGCQIALGVAAAHAHGITHGDLKPANIMVTDEQNAKVLDFGLARQDERTIDPDATTLAEAGGSTLTGTPNYMSPEQARGEHAIAQSDVFALGLILWEMVTGKRALSGRTLLEVLSRIHTIDPDALADQVPEPFAQVVRQALVPAVPERKIRMAGIAEVLGT